jgi:hypothetical protein
MRYSICFVSLLMIFLVWFAMYLSPSNSFQNNAGAHTVCILNLIHQTHNKGRPYTVLLQRKRRRIKRCASFDSSDFLKSHVHLSCVSFLLLVVTAAALLCYALLHASRLHCSVDNDDDDWMVIPLLTYSHYRI